VVDFEQKATQEYQGKQAGEIVAEWLITSLVKTGRFDVVERAQLQKVLKEQQLGMTGMISQETAARVGELLGVKVIITGSVIQIGNTVEVNARLINVEDGSILKAEKIRGPGLEAIERMMDSLVEVIKRDFPLEGFVVMVSGKRAMIDLGRVHGVEPGMKFSAFRKGEPVRHPITGKMLKGEDIKLGEMAVQSVTPETSWAEILIEEPGIKIAAGNLVKQSTEEAVAAAPAPAPIPAKPTPKPVQIWTGKIRSAKILIEWAGFNDLILGDRDGFVTVSLNQGSKDSPVYGEPVKLKAGGKDIKVRGPSAPCLVDWNGDGRADLLVGDGGGYLHLYLNQGPARSPTDLAPEVMVQAAGKRLDVGSKASPCVVDWNEDGKKDLAMGNGSGEIFLYLNEGTNEQPTFGKPIKLNGGSLDVGSNSSPDVADWKGDGKKDLIIGNSDGEIFVFLNKGTNEDPQYSNEGDKLLLKFGQDASPRVISWGRSGSNDPMVADRNGEEVILFINTGGPPAPQFPEKKLFRAGTR
jgi:TolB-like protein